MLSLGLSLHLAMGQEHTILDLTASAVLIQPEAPILLGKKGLTVPFTDLRESHTPRKHNTDPVVQGLVALPVCRTTILLNLCHVPNTLYTLSITQMKGP